MRKERGGGAVETNKNMSMFLNLLVHRNVLQRSGTTSHVPSNFSIESFLLSKETIGQIVATIDMIIYTRYHRPKTQTNPLLSPPPFFFVITLDLNRVVRALFLSTGMLTTIGIETSRNRIPSIVLDYQLLPYGSCSRRYAFQPPPPWFQIKHRVGTYLGT